VGSLGFRGGGGFCLVFGGVLLVCGFFLFLFWFAMWEILYAVSLLLGSHDPGFDPWHPSKLDDGRTAQSELQLVFMLTLTWFCVFSQPQVTLDGSKTPPLYASKFFAFFVFSSQHLISSDSWIQLIGVVLQHAEDMFWTSVM